MLHTLIVEDEFISRKVLNAILAPLGSCDIAANGREALQAFEAAMKAGPRYHLVCLDINMPGMDGHAVLRTIRVMEKAAGVSRQDRARVIMTTGSGDRENIQGAFQLQCDSYLIKPIDRSVLMTKLAQLGLAP